LKNHFITQQQTAAEKKAEAQKKVNFYSLLRLSGFAAVVVSIWFWINPGQFDRGSCFPGPDAYPAVGPAATAVFSEYPVGQHR
jgi:hypothetical protein